MTYSFLELLILFWLTLADIYCLEFIPHHVKETSYVNTNSKGNQSGNLIFAKIWAPVFTFYFWLINLWRNNEYDPSSGFIKLWSSERNTVSSFCFKKMVMHRVEEINVDIPNEIDLDDHLKLKCLYFIHWRSRVSKD